KEKRLQRSPLSTDSSRNPGSSPTRRRKAATGVMRSDRTSRHTGTMAWRAASSWNSARLGFSPLLLVVGEARLMALVGGGGCAGPVTAEAPVEAGDVPGVAGALPLLVDEEQEHVAVAVVERLTDPLPVPRGVALGPPLLAGAAPVHHPARLQRLPQGRLVHPPHH